MQHNHYSIHATGNGHILIYKHGADIIQYFGSPYSSPSLGSVKVSDDEGNPINNQDYERIPFSDVYSHKVKDTVLTDFCFDGEPIFVRDIKGGDIMHTFVFSDEVSVKDISFKYGAAKVCQAVIKSGTYIFFKYPTNKPICYNIVFTSDNPESITFEDNTIKFKGEGRFAVIGGPSYPDTTIYTERYLKSDIVAEKEKSIKGWGTYFNGLTDYEKMLPSDLPERECLLKAIENTAIAIRTQQDKEGGVIAGYPYHLGYVRDQLGVVKGMLKLGMINEAFKILYYFLKVFKREGRINNAQGLGIEGVLHVHENDDVEITGYLVLMFFDFYSYIHDAEERKKLFNEFFPLLAWALDVQIKQIVSGMIPFNGDETYIAGGILPRNTIFDGSAEATVLFIDGAALFIDEIKKLGLRFDTKEIERALKECKSRFAENFIVNGKLITNNPKRTEKGSVPRFRHGVCEGYCGYFGWLERCDNGLYLCLDCQKHKHLKGKAYINDRKIFALKSVLLLPLFINSSFIVPGDLTDEIYGISEEYLKTGKLPSVAGGSLNVGYDFGFLLIGLNQVLKHIEDGDYRKPVLIKAAVALYKDTLNIVDRTYTWCEYYKNKACAGTQYRPWESAINIKALIEFAEIYDRVR